MKHLYQLAQFLPAETQRRRRSGQSRRLLNHDIDFELMSARIPMNLHTDENSISFDIHFNNARFPQLRAPVHDSMIGHLGQIGVQWGYFEQIVDQHIATLLAHTGNEEPGWERRNYRKRRALLDDQAAIVFANRRRIYVYLKKILNDSAEMHWKRNTLLHGHLMTRVNRPDPTGPTILSLVAHGRHNGRDIRIEKTADELKEMSYDIMHLSGRLGVIGAVPGPDHAPLPLSDKAFLRRLWMNRPLTPPILPEPPPPHRSRQK